MTIRIVLADDQALLRKGFRMILEAEDDLEIVGEAADGADAVRLVELYRPDVVLMDVRMPRLDGVAATRQLRAECPSTPVMALTTFDDDEALAGMLRAGATGFVLKGVAAEELHRAVRVVAEGGAWLDPAVTNRVLAVYRAAPAGPAARPGALHLLTSREREVLGLIGQGQTNAEIAERLFVSEGTVKTHVNHLFTKLDLRDRSAAIIFAYDNGMIDHPG